MGTTMNPYLAALIGGTLIGLAAVLMLHFNGRILGVSGIVGGVLQKNAGNSGWRYAFLLGLLVGGSLILSTIPQAFDISIIRTPAALVVAGLLVGYGTRLGNGCTSGHGICGVSRLSPRSLMATITFMVFGAATVFVINHILGGRI